MKKVKRKISAEILKELNFLEALARRCPHDIDILKALGDLYTKIGRYEDGLKIDLELSRLCAHEPLAWYNLACSYALLAHKEEALSALSRAVDLGYKDYLWIRKDSDLDSIKHDQRFKAILLCLMAGKDTLQRRA